MKKAFIEPKMKRIELNIKENIASSVVHKNGYGMYSSSLFRCKIVETGMTVPELEDKFGEDYDTIDMWMDTCKDVAPSGHIVPAEEVMRYMGW